MRRTFLVFVLLCLLLNAATGYIFACNLQLTPSSFSVQPGGEVNFHLERTRTSDQCPDSPASAAITVTGGDLTDSGSWKTGDTDSLDFTAKFDGTTPPAVNVTFNCNVTGLATAQAKGTIQSTASASAETPTDTDTVKKSSGVSSKKDTEPLPSLQPAEETNNPVTTTPANNDKDTLEILSTQLSVLWSVSPLGLKLWYLYLILGLLFYFLKLKQLRKPLLFSGIIVLGFLAHDFANPNPVLFQLFGKQINYYTVLPFLLIPVVISFILGRFFCGWVCPAGAIQEFISPDGQKRLIPTPLDRVLKYLKYILLLLLIFYIVKGRDLWNSNDPFKTLFSFKGTFLSIIFLGFLLLSAVFIERPFCRYICPMGAILSITSRLSFIKMRADANQCMVCGRCTAGDCPMDAISAFNPEVDLPRVDSAECIYCFRCQKQCRKHALHVTGFRIDHVASLVGKDEEG